MVASASNGRELWSPVTAYLPSPEWKAIASQIRSRGAVTLLGSGISDWKPTGLPAGQSMTAALATLLSEGVEPIEVISTLVKKTAFEHAMEACPRQNHLGSKLRVLYASTTTNPIHEAVAELLRAGILRHIITTNYDGCLEAACREASVKHQIVVTKDDAFTKDDVLRINLSLPVIFKIHGCAVTDGTGTEPTMIYSLRREGALDKWKSDLMARLMAGRQLLVCGYSGMDFEICPQLENLAPHEVLWNSFRFDDEEPIANARRVLRACGGTILVGDMRVLLGDLLASVEPVAAERETDREKLQKMTASLLETMRHGFSDRDLLLWQARLFSGIGCADALVSVGQRLLPAVTSDEESVEGRWALGRGRFHQGKYFQASKSYSEAVRLADKPSLRTRRLELLLDKVEADRCAGRYFRAWRGAAAVRRSATEGDGYLKSKAALGKARMWRHVYQVFEPLSNMPLLELIVSSARGVARDYLREAATGAAGAGEWLDYQQCELWASRLLIPIEEICPSDLRPLPSQLGYLQLGYLVARSMAIRDAMKQGGQVDVNDITACLKAFDQLGAKPEFWKLAKAFGRWQRQCARKALGECEYRPLHRKLIWLRS